MAEETADAQVVRAPDAVDRAFGEANRRRIIDEYFTDAGAVTTANAWLHVYRLLLWINPTISLAHCYESDKCQPHKPWYPRSLAFHKWVADQMAVPPGELRNQIDHLFRAALPALAHVETEARRQAAIDHLGRYEGAGMPLPGDDPDLIELITDTLGLALQPTAAQSQRLVEVVYAHFAQENKRKNLLGRGFEDTLAAIVARLAPTPHWHVGTRVTLDQIPGFRADGEAAKRSEVDLAIWDPAGTSRTLVSVKWSVRADRERQFDSDFDDYSRSNVGGPFTHVLITNEFDAARLDAACSRVRGNQYLFSDVVHVNPEGVLVAYGPPATPSATTGQRQKSRNLRGHLDSGRLTSLERWLDETFPG